MEGTDLNWRKSSYSGNGGGECVEIGASADAVVVRDTAERAGLVLRFTPAAWRRFTGQVKQSLVSILALAEACGGCPGVWQWPLRRPGYPARCGPLQPRAITARTAQDEARDEAWVCDARPDRRVV